MKIFNRPVVNWIVDAVLFVGFLVCFFLDFTGVLAHQWLGVAGAVLAGYHLVAHWKWVKTVTARLLGQTSAQARLYYALDAGILAGLAAITATGLAISTWLALPLDDYPTWRDVHVAASVITLALIVVKIGVHWRWIVSTARRYIFNVAPAADAPRAARPAARLGRREFLGMMSGVSLAAVVAAGSVLRGDGSGEAAAETTSAAPSADPQPAAVAAPAAVEQASSSVAAVDTAATTGQSAGNNQASQATAASPTATSAPTAVPTATATATATAEPIAEPIAVACTVRCPRGCSYPGRCRRYTDTNGNNKCDLGECL